MKIITKALALSLTLSLIGATSLMGTKKWAEISTDRWTENDNFRTENEYNIIGVSTSEICRPKAPWILTIPLEDVSAAYTPTKLFIKRKQFQPHNRRIRAERQFELLLAKTQTEQQLKCGIIAQKIKLHNIQNIKNELKLINANEQNRLSLSTRRIKIKEQFSEKIKAIKQYADMYDKIKNQCEKESDIKRFLLLEEDLNELSNINNSLKDEAKYLQVKLDAFPAEKASYIANSKDANKKRIELEKELRKLISEYKNFTSSNIKHNDSLGLLNKSPSLKSFKSGLESKTPSPRSNQATPSPRSNRTCTSSLKSIFSSESFHTTSPRSNQTTPKNVTQRNPKFRNLTTADISHNSPGSLSISSDELSGYESDYNSDDVSSDHRTSSYDKSSSYESDYNSDDVTPNSDYNYTEPTIIAPTKATRKIETQNKPPLNMFSLNKADRDNRKDSVRKRR